MLYDIMDNQLERMVFSVSEQKNYVPSLLESLNLFRDSIDACRNEMKTLSIVDERTFDYAIIRAYSKALLTCCEIYTLLKAGYPEGALALSRSLYEAMVIIETLLQGRSENDSAMLERFFDMIDISRINNDLTTVSWVLKQEPNNTNAQQEKTLLEQHLDVFKKKHQCDRFGDYWWTGKNNMGELAGSSGFAKAYMYQRTSGNVHFNVFDIFTYSDMSDNTILVGSTDKGLDLPLWFATLCMRVICGIIHGNCPNLVSESTVEKTECAAQAASLLHTNMP